MQVKLQNFSADGNPNRYFQKRKSEIQNKKTKSIKIRESIWLMRESLNSNLKNIIRNDHLDTKEFWQPGQVGQVGTEGSINLHNPKMPIEREPNVTGDRADQ